MVKWFVGSTEQVLTHFFKCLQGEVDQGLNKRVRWNPDHFYRRSRSHRIAQLRVKLHDAIRTSWALRKLLARCSGLEPNSHL